MSNFLSGVYFEKVLKSSDTSLWVRNIQMYLSGIVVTLVGVYLSDGAEIKEKGFFYGYTYYVWFVICKYPGIKGSLVDSVLKKKLDVHFKLLQYFEIVPLYCGHQSENVILILLTYFHGIAVPKQFCLHNQR